MRKLCKGKAVSKVLSATDRVCCDSNHLYPFLTIHFLFKILDNFTLFKKVNFYRIHSISNFCCSLKQSIFEKLPLKRLINSYIFHDLYTFTNTRTVLHLKALWRSFLMCSSKLHPGSALFSHIYDVFLICQSRA